MARSLLSSPRTTDHPLNLPPELLAAFPPSKTALLDRVRQDVDDDMLREISRADYGYKAEELFPPLVQMRDSGRIPVPMSGWLDEVLTLTRWSDPDHPNRRTGIAGHWTRLFACVVLMLRSVIDTDRDDEAADATLAQCLASARVLPDDVNAALGSFLVWRLSRTAWNPNELCDSLGLLIVVLRLREGRITEPQIGGFAALILAEDQRMRQSSGPHFAPGRPLPFSVQRGFWTPLAAELQRAGGAMTDGAARENVLLCAMQLEPG